MDTSGLVLHRAVAGVTLAELRASGLTVTDSQILLLITYGLIGRQGDLLTTAFPVIGPEKMNPLRETLSQLAETTAPSLVGDVLSIVDELKIRNFPDHGYATVFGYALDGLFWHQLRQRGALPDTTLDLEHPFWRGAFWALFPERTGVPGTNETAMSNAAVVSVWTDDTVEALHVMTGRLGAPDSEARELWLSRIPTIRPVAGDPIHEAALRIAARTAHALLETAEGQAVLESISIASQQEATLILAHEFIWDLTDPLSTALTR